MDDIPDRLIATPLPDVMAVAGVGEPLRAILSSLACGGAERIVTDWLSTEAHRGRAVELAVLHRRRHELALPGGITVHRRGCEDVEAFVCALGARWRPSPAPVATHLVSDALLALLWAAGVRTIPVLHNTREGWRNAPSSWSSDHVPLALACAEAVRLQAEAAGCRVPLATIRHAPPVDRRALDAAERTRIRNALGIGPSVFLVGAVGALKPQKDYARAVEVLAALRRRRDAALVILGGVLDGDGLAELEQVVDRAVARGVATALRLPGFVDPIGPWYAACDAILNVSRHEGLSMATREALSAGLPAVATDVGGQGEIAQAGLKLLPPCASAEDFAHELARLPVRASLTADPVPRHPRAWTVAMGMRARAGREVSTLFVTANLNAGGAQRSLVNLATTIAGRHRLAIAVCGETTHGAFPACLAGAGVEWFRPAAGADPFDVSEAILAQATARGVQTLCFWNADPRVKLLLARFAPRELRLVDACPGAYAWHELESAASLSQALAFAPEQYYRRLDVLVTKYDDPASPACRRREVIPNGVAPRHSAFALPAAPRFLCSGRIAPSKRLERVLEAFAAVARVFPGARLDIVGQAEPRHRDYLRSVLVAAEGLPVHFRGALPDLHFLDEPFTAAVVLGTHQGCPNAILEAMAAGLAVIANDSGGTRTVVQSGHTGWLLPEECPTGDLAAAMGEACEAPLLAQALGKNGRALAARHFSLDAMAFRYLSLFETSPVADPRQNDGTHDDYALQPA